jgi:hypothetical protein
VIHFLQIWHKLATFANLKLYSNISGNCKKQTSKSGEWENRLLLQNISTKCGKCGCVKHLSYCVLCALRPDFIQMNAMSIRCVFMYSTCQKFYWHMNIGRICFESWYIWVFVNQWSWNSRCNTVTTECRHTYEVHVQCWHNTLWLKGKRRCLKARPLLGSTVNWSHNDNNVSRYGLHSW